MAERDEGHQPWSRWGSYLSDRQWGTVREDYSADGNAWSSFPHEHARMRCYRWGEDGLLGISDEKGLLCFGLALWNGRDPILKERPFGLANGEGNHGEDLKDYFFHLLNTPTHSFMRGLYKYPQQEFPYQHLVEENGRRGRDQPEYELVETGIFDDNRYFDVFVDYAKASPEDLLIRIRVVNRGAEEAELSLIPTLWLRNLWDWGYKEDWRQRSPICRDGDGIKTPDIHGIGSYQLACRQQGTWLFTENATNTERLYQQPNSQPYVKDAFHRYLVDGDQDAVNPAQEGTKAGLLLQQRIAGGGEWVVDLRLARQLSADPFDASFDQLLQQREQECLDYFDSCAPGLSADDALIFRSAASGLL